MVNFTCNLTGLREKQLGGKLHYEGKRKLQNKTITNIFKEINNDTESQKQSQNII